MIGYQDRTSGAVEHCESMSASHPGGAIAEAYDTLAEYCRNKLWHQLTLLVLDMIRKPSIYATTEEETGSHSFLALYDKVVLCVDSKLNALSLAKIAATVALAILPTDSTAAKALLENLLAKNEKDKDNNNAAVLTIPATIYVQSKLASLILTTAGPEVTEFSALVAQFKTNKATLHQFPAEGNSEVASVHAAHYEATMHYHKRVGPPEAFYEQALSYLQHMGPEFSTLSSSDGGGGSHNKSSESLISAHQLAVDLILAALTGDGVYNLGQVEQTPVLKLLQETPEDTWLVHLLQATAAGDVARFRQYERDYATQIASQPALVHRASAVTEKLALLALVTLVFSKPSHERLVTFTEIASALHLADHNMDQVEWIVMRALSVHLMEGSIDQVDQTVNVTWVMPRVLTNDQMQQLATRFGEWAITVSKTQESMTAAIA